MARLDTGALERELARQRMSVDDLAACCGLGIAQFHELLRGASVIETSLLERLADSLGILPSDIVSPN